LTACAPHDQVRLAIAAQQSPSQILPYLAAELGHFRDEGLEVRVEEFPGSAKAMQALLGGSVDVVTGYHEQVLSLDSGAPPVRSFFLMTNSQMVALAVSPAGSARIHRIEDLRGAEAGVTTLGSATHVLLNYLLARHGIRPDEVKPVAIGTASRAVAAMERGVVQAGVVSDFTVRTIAKRGAVRILADTRTRAGVLETYGTADYPGAAMFARASWLNAHPDQARRLAAAFTRTREWILARPLDEVIARIPASHHGDDPALYREVIRGAVDLLDRDGRFSEEGASAAARMVNADPARAKEAHTNAYLD